ncbi:hypothetical protein Tco_0670794 [Tanacetum coccineum]
MHNDIMAAGLKESLPMLASGNYAQWSSRFMRYIDTKLNNDQLRQCIEKGPYILIELVTSEVSAEGDNPVQPQGVGEETYLNTTPKNKKLIDAEVEAIHMILNEIGDNIYSTVDACLTAQEMWLAIERLQQGESINKQDVQTKLMINEMVRNKLKVDTIQFLQQLQPKWSRFVTIVKQQSDLDTVSFHKLFDILKQHQNEVNEIRAERIARNANPLALIGKFGNQRTVTVVENRETVGNQDEWLQDTDEEPDEQELEAHYMYMAKI